MLVNSGYPNDNQKMKDGEKMPQEDQDLVFQKTCELLKVFNVNNIELTKDTDIATDLEIDSVAILDLIMELEDSYDISFPMNLMSELRTVGDLVESVQKLVSEK